MASLKIADDIEAQHGASSPQIPKSMVGSVVTNPLAVSPGNNGALKEVRVAALPTAVANPAPLGLLAFGMTTIMLMFAETAWEPNSFGFAVFGFACFYGGIGQLLAGMWSMYKNQVFAATALSSYGCFWLGWLGLNVVKWIYDWNSGEDPLDWDTGESIWLFSWAALTFLFAIVTIFGTKNYALQGVFVTLTITFILLAVGKVTNEKVTKAGGYIGFICGCIAIYTAIGELWEETIHVKLPGLP